MDERTVTEEDFEGKEGYMDFGKMQLFRLKRIFISASKAQ